MVYEIVLGREREGRDGRDEGGVSEGN